MTLPMGVKLDSNERAWSPRVDDHPDGGQARCSGRAVALRAQHPGVIFPDPGQEGETLCHRSDKCAPLVSIPQVEATITTAIYPLPFTHHRNLKSSLIL